MRTFSVFFRAVKKCNRILRTQSHVNFVMAYCYPLQCIPPLSHLLEPHSVFGLRPWLCALHLAPPHAMIGVILLRLHARNTTGLGWKMRLRLYGT
jgi:hypothetical protein